ncbi:hypothetical protein [Methylobacterium sp. 285MFTsu5.1]|uniref:hypothetical protein n=1 Tax=Methylobacterium sp. 285MFTsu5.1 TaxID=1172187 RepID=UPI000369C2A0|nr:hypothetical protein [Methylobacterium sp. 285MFTsu5.1]
MDERVLCLLQTFAEIERELGADVFDGVIERARLAVAAEVMVEAERRAIRSRRGLPPGGCEVIAFPDRGCPVDGDG